MSSLAARTRGAVRERPALRVALAAGAVNHTAAARLLADDLDLGPSDHEAVAAALRRYADDLRLARTSTAASVRMVTGVGLDAERAGDVGDAVLSVGDRVVHDGSGRETALVIEGEDLSGGVLSTVIDRLDAEGVTVEAAGVAGDRAVAVVNRRRGADALRAVESALDAVPDVFESADE